MKSLFLLIVLLPLCHSSNKTLGLTREIVHRLGDLNQLYMSKKVMITSGDKVNVPSRIMKENTSTCMSVFKKELMHVLNSLTVVEETHLIEEIKVNLKDLQTNGTMEDERCTVQPLSRGSKAPFKQYIIFLQKFINSPAHG